LIGDFKLHLTSQNLSNVLYSKIFRKDAIKELKLDVKTIIQSWPVADYGVKTVIPFEDLEKSMGK